MERYRYPSQAASPATHSHAYATRAPAAFKVHILPYVVASPSWRPHTGIYSLVHATIGVSQGRTHCCAHVFHTYPADPIHPCSSLSFPTMLPLAPHTPS